MTTRRFKNKPMNQKNKVMSDMKNILFLTSSYPYYPGEQFIENEIRYWSEQSGIKVYIAPYTANGTPRKVPSDINVNLELASASMSDHFFYAIYALFSSVFWREVCFVITKYGVSIRCIYQALRASASTLRLKNGIKTILKQIGDADVAYCYWNNSQAYAATILKKEGIVKKVFSRAHGYDLYENRNKNNYLPLKRQFIDDVDFMLAISEQGKKYIESTYDANTKNILVSRLGVPLNEIYAACSPNNKLHILSVSFCVPVKQINKIIDGMALSKKKLEHIEVHWTHIGNGPLLGELVSMAEERLACLGIGFTFTGIMGNADVKKYYELNAVDLFINASESEGVPVSIMEAMSYGVPAIAPNVGGISEIVSNECGVLLGCAPTSAEISDAICRMSSKCKAADFRAKAKDKISVLYDAKKNYKELVELVSA